MSKYKMTLTFFDGKENEEFDQYYDNVSMENLLNNRLSLIVKGDKVELNLLKYWIDSYEEAKGKYLAIIRLEDKYFQGIYPYCRLTDYIIEDDYISLVINYGATS